MTDALDCLKAALAGALGKRDEGVNLLRQAFAEGLGYSWRIRVWDPELAPLRDVAEFQELMRPKG